jgi:hypothetical protein
MRRPRRFLSFALSVRTPNRLHLASTTQGSSRRSIVKPVSESVYRDNSATRRTSLSFAAINACGAYVEIPCHECTPKPNAVAAAITAPSCTSPSCPPIARRKSKLCTVGTLVGLHWLRNVRAISMSSRSTGVPIALRGRIPQQHKFENRSRAIVSACSLVKLVTCAARALAVAVMVPKPSMLRPVERKLGGLFSYRLARVINLPTCGPFWPIIMITALCCSQYRFGTS